ncbi:carbon monoxide dehydrogenase subunit G [Haloactinopolyspora alba]|uniref:Carbon monoxide dehydrogenase subunit G n=1 Tax=Haloactinopolyspora alba TaxID=648780 RepID=A0A2P8EBM3_9ACTN|nr:SRPBCC family protein [Haloactinopolyspora alba]PSL06881.1 carbon monoxide dehydrogenase subunit G [Haloactinopolyspora alba]
MQLDHQFTVPAPVEDAWKVLLDVPRIAPCMPGATLDEFDGETFKGSVKVRLGPISLLYKGQGRFVETDDAAHRLVIEASGKESRGSGTAAATVTSTLVADGDSTRVDVNTDLKITGRPAQFGRGMLNDVGSKLLGQFADCLARTLGEGSTAEPAGADTASAAGTTATADASPPAAGTTGAAPAAGTTAAAGSTTAPPGSAASTDTSPQEHSSAPAGSTQEVEPIDLLQITGAQAALRRYGPAVAATAGVAVLAWLAVRRRRS